MHSYFEYDEDDGNLVLASISTEAMEVLIRPTYDVFGRTTKKEYEMGSTSEYALFLEQTYDYKKNGAYESLLVSEMTSTVTSAEGDAIASTTYKYTYDENGNITQIANASNVVQYRYAYDDLGQLIREDNRPLGKTYVYAYDNAGNRTSKTTYALSLTSSVGTAIGTEMYSYYGAWNDQLYGNSLSELWMSYDAVGNPTSMSYWGDPCELVWQGRQLQQVTLSGDTTSFTYNADGIRTSKTVNGVRHDYYLSGSQILGETWTQNGTSHFIMYLYDETGVPIGLQYRTSSYAEDVFRSYFFERNLQGDIVAIYNKNDVKICTYTYDAWGNFTVSLTSGISTLDRNIANTYNPFRYRGYYYDVETGWYYLQSRYYNPAWGRFINADGYASTGQGLQGYNMYAYCNNSPVVHVDSEGTVCVNLLQEFRRGFVLPHSRQVDFKPYDKFFYDKNKDGVPDAIWVSVQVRYVPTESIRDTVADIVKDIYNDSDSSEFLHGNKVDEKQLYGEILFHRLCWKFHIIKWKADPADIHIYSNGEVRDSRPIVNRISRKLGEPYD